MKKSLTYCPDKCSSSIKRVLKKGIIDQISFKVNQDFLNLVKAKSQKSVTKL